LVIVERFLLIYQKELTKSHLRISEHLQVALGIKPLKYLFGMCFTEKIWQK